MRQALTRARVSASSEGWRLTGSLDRSAGSDSYLFDLQLSARGEPVSLALRRTGASRDILQVGYGPERNYPAGRIPSWITWSFSGSVVTLRVEDHASTDPAKIRYGISIEPGWTIVSLDEPAGQNMVRWLLGLSEGGTER